MRRTRALAAVCIALAVAAAPLAAAADGASSGIVLARKKTNRTGEQAARGGVLRKRSAGPPAPPPPPLLALSRALSTPATTLQRNTTATVAPAAPKATAAAVALNAGSAAAANNKKAAAVPAAVPAANKPAPATAKTTPTLFAAISAHPDLSSFAEALRLIGVDDELSQPDARTTVFAPTNAALDAFAREAAGAAGSSGGEAPTAALLSERYATLLRRVVANGAGVDLRGDGVHTTYGGQEVRVAKNGDGALVATALPASRGVEARVLGAAEGAIDLGANGRVYLVDRVLHPEDVILARVEAPWKPNTRSGSNKAAPGPSNTTTTTATTAATTANNPDTLRAMLAADADLSSFSRLLQLLAPELLAAAATAAPVTVFAPSNAAVDAYLGGAHAGAGLASVDDVERAVTVARPAAAKRVEAAAAAATAAAAAGARSTRPSEAAAASAAAAAEAQKELQRLLRLRADLTAAVAYHVSPGLAVDGATLLEGGRLLPTLLAAAAAPAEGQPVRPASDTRAAAVVGERAGDGHPAAAPVLASTAPLATKMIGARAGGDGKGAAVMLGDLGSSAAVLSSALAGDDGLHKLDALLAFAADPAAEGPSPGVAVAGGGGDVAVPSADGLTSDAVAGGARGGLDVGVRNSIIQNAMQANIHRALAGGMSVHQAAVINGQIASLAPFATPYFYLLQRAPYASGYNGGYWMG